MSDANDTTKHTVVYIDYNPETHLLAARSIPENKVLELVVAGYIMPIIEDHPAESLHMVWDKEHGFRPLL